VWAGLPDPASTRNELAERADTEVGALRLLLRAWPEIDPDGSGVTAAQLLSAIGTGDKRYERVRSAVFELVPTPGDKLPTAKRVGMKFSFLYNRVVDGMSLDRRDDKWGVVWSVRSTQGAS